MAIRMMRALVLDGGRSLALREIDPPDVPGECRIHILMAGICGTDLQILDSYADFTGVPGHEFVGIVESAPPDAGHLKGQRVVGEINVGCGYCDWCAAGVKEHCAAREVLGIRGRGGAFAEFISLPASNLHLVPDELANAAAVFVEPVAAACRILEQVDVSHRTSVAVVGDGRLGLLVAQALRIAGAPVCVFGRHAHKLNVARALDLPVESVIEPRHARAFDVVVDATGRPGGLRDALRLAKARGTVVVKSTFHGEGQLETWPLVVDEITIIGSRCGPFQRALQLLERGAVQVAPLIERVFPLVDFEAAFTTARTGLKALLDPTR